MKRIRYILLGSAAACALALYGVWWTVSVYAELHTHKMLGLSREIFEQSIENALDATLWYTGSMAAYYLDYSTRSRSVEKMQELAEFLCVDELTVVGTNGIAVASNYREFVGFDWRTRPETAAYLELFNPRCKTQKIMQPFRKCVLRPEFYRKFGAVVFTNRLGLVEVGYSMERLVKTIAFADVEAFKRWSFGRHGRFGAIDSDGDGIPDPVDSTVQNEEQVVRFEKIDAADGRWYRLTFSFAGHKFYAEVPDREYGDQRNAAFLAAAFFIVLLVLLFTIVFVQLRISTLHVEKLHIEAERRNAADLKLAHAIQMSTLPHAATFNPECLAYDFEAVMKPAREVGGDLYGFFALADGRVAFGVGDVSGKGVPAAMFMLVAKNAIRMALNGQGDPAVAMAAANKALCSDNEAGMFVTMVLGVFDPSTGEVTYVNAGHNRPYVVRSDGSVERLEVRGGRMLGLFPGLEYRASHLRLGKNDRLFLYTDGVTEAMDAGSRLYGEERLRQLLATNPPSLCEAVCADVARHVAGATASDDIAILTLAWRGAPIRHQRTFPVCEASIRQVLDFLREVCPLSGHRDFARLLQVADEVVANVIEYSEAETFTVEVEAGRDRCKFILSDGGREYNPLAHPEPDVHAPIEKRQIGGLGIFLARKFSDYISWRRENGQNRLTVVKYLR